MASAIEAEKRIEALDAWTHCKRDNYGVDPIFSHVDKYLGKIGTPKKAWDCKISLCWWHLQRAVRTRHGKDELATTPYDVKKQCAEFDFINADFILELEWISGITTGADDVAETDVNLIPKLPQCNLIHAGIR